MSRRKYPVSIVVNGRKIHTVIIDPHFEEKHSDSISDEIIIQLVKKLDGLAFEPEMEKPPYAYFTLDKIMHKGKYYRLIWLLEKDKLYIGVVNAYRR